MKLTTKKLNPKHLFKSKTLSRSFSSSLTASSSSPESSHTKSKSNGGGVTTPTSVLPNDNNDVQFELLQAFKIMDTDGDGRIPRSELTALLTRIGGSEEEVSMMVNEIDTDGDGCISLEEFGVISSVFGPVNEDEEDEIRGAFEFFDTDGDGLITADELFEVFKVIGDGRCTLDECRRMIRSVDENRDGFVCFEDFRTMMDCQR